MPVETRKRKAMAQAAIESAEPTPSQPTSTTKRQRKLPVRSKDDDQEPKADAPTAASKRSNVITFDDDGNADRELVIPAKPVEASKPAEQEEESDSDEAPEAVSTTKVAVEMKKSAQAEKKAAREQAAAEKQKRQQRDALFKQQASERKVETQTEEVLAPTQEVSGRKRSGKIVIPSVLPAEFLTDSDSEEEDEMESSLGQDLPRRRTVSGVEKRMSRDGRGPRDEVIGSTVYRISKKVDERLAPKARKYSKSTKDTLLKRGRAPVQGRSGFFKK
ncbi:hypothetical protein MAC_03705 [Metarhizium acridum CQMa 102]|uniref:U3 snoRNA associated n=1 Tax=Metarhizium acridum (strain CQMa 102) TaxID=655827 RepID=E9E1F7_METAQ|nr:uncharacterized protein MAC_03705 [Metarhizium acridum CQMa 102]EFY90190.1 hypothetical protein MAC_03705 [Metarhizium acridum CQMa 102]